MVGPRDPRKLVPQAVSPPAPPPARRVTPPSERAHQPQPTGARPYLRHHAHALDDEYDRHRENEKRDGEAARLLNCSTRDVVADRFAAATTISENYGGVCVLKGAGTLVQEHGAATLICSGGNPGMASGGMGDLLTGVIGALIAQGIGLTDAAKLGVAMHAAAGDTAARQGGERGMLASDLLPRLRILANPDLTK